MNHSVQTDFFNQNHQDQPLSNTTQKYCHGVLLVWFKKVGFHLSKIDLDLFLCIYLLF